MRNWSRFCDSLPLYLPFSHILTSFSLPLGAAVGHYSADWVPLCKHTHSCLSGPSIWRNKETQGHHSCFLSVWLSSDIRHHEAASVETDTVRISCIPHRRESSWCWQQWLHGKASPASSRADTQTKAWQRGSPCQMKSDRSESSLLWSNVALRPAHSLTPLPAFSKLQTILLKREKILCSRFPPPIPNLILCYSLFLHLRCRYMAILKAESTGYKLKRHPA